MSPWPPSVFLQWLHLPNGTIIISTHFVALPTTQARFRCYARRSTSNRFTHSVLLSSLYSPASGTVISALHGPELRTLRHSNQVSVPFGVCHTLHYTKLIYNDYLPTFTVLRLFSYCTRGSTSVLIHVHQFTFFIVMFCRCSRSTLLSLTIVMVIPPFCSFLCLTLAVLLAALICSHRQTPCHHARSSALLPLSLNKARYTDIFIVTFLFEYFNHLLTSNWITYSAWIILPHSLDLVSALAALHRT